MASGWSRRAMLVRTRRSIVSWSSMVPSSCFKLGPLRDHGGGGRLRGAGVGDAACLSVDLGGGVFDVAGQDPGKVSGVADVALVLATVQWPVVAREHSFSMLQGSGLVSEALLGSRQDRARILPLDWSPSRRGFGVLEGVEDFEASLDEMSELAVVEDSRPVRFGVVQFVAAGVSGLVDPVGGHRADEDVEGGFFADGGEERLVGFGSHNNSCLPKRDFVTPTPLHRVEPTPNGEKTSQLLQRNTEDEAGRAQRVSG